VSSILQRSTRPVPNEASLMAAALVLGRLASVYDPPLRTGAR
jgi:hypothetical protein